MTTPFSRSDSSYFMEVSRKDFVDMVSNQPDEFTAGWNRWYSESFEACLKPHLHEIEQTFEAIADALDDVNKSFDAHAADIRKIAEVIGGTKGADGKLEMRRLDDVLTKMRAEIFKSLRVSLKRELSSQGAVASSNNVLAIRK
jgi:hypothetical protein